MKSYGLNELREMYLKFFEEKGHLKMKSFPLVPQNDKSLLLINAGMAPLKPYFTGQETPPSKRVTTCQKCIRTGDIENIGKTARHGTFFEMLGNFSFGDYFKEEAIAWAWEFITEVLELDIERLHVSVYEEDEEAAEIWRNKIGVPNEKIHYLGKDDNFWEVGTVGPCGPCSEIHYDRGPEYGCDSPDCSVGCDCDRFLEFWNLVFTQFNKEEDGSYTPLPNPNIDTGMGLERLAAMMQGVDSLFDVDTVKAIRDKVCELAGVTYGESRQKDVSIRIITDHVRSSTFMASDGVRISNEGRGYVLRRLLRRAIRHGKLLGIEGTFITEVVKVAIENSKNEYTELVEKYDYIMKAFTIEEERFNETIEQGFNILEGYISKLEENEQTVLDGASCFKLYDTYGFPIDLTSEILEEKGLTVDEAGFKEAMEAQRERARSAQGETTYMGSDETIFHQMDTAIHTEFVGYTKNEIESPITYIATEDAIVEEAHAGEMVYIVSTQTPFYAESGGQAGDQGVITTATGKVEVVDTIKVVGGKFAHKGEVVSGNIQANQVATFTVENSQRVATARNHTATHLLQKVLRDVVGGHIEQAGSNVTKDRLRFDYTHFEALSAKQIKEVEQMVNDKILQGLVIEVKETSIDEAKAMGATALFGEKYGDTVRVVNMGDYSIELCGGTHLENTAQIGTFKIVSETGVAAGVRRIEAVTGRAALNYYQGIEETLNTVAKTMKAKPVDIVKKAEITLKDYKELQKELESLKAQIAKQEAGQVLDRVEEISGKKVLITAFENMDGNALRNMGDDLKDQLQDGVVVLASHTDGKVSLVAMATKEAVNSGIHCGQIIKTIAPIVKGGGGGRPNMAQAGGKDHTQIEQALTEAKKVVALQLG